MDRLLPRDLICESFEYLDLCSISSCYQVSSVWAEHAVVAVYGLRAGRAFKDRRGQQYFRRHKQRGVCILRLPGTISESMSFKPTKHSSTARRRRDARKLQKKKSRKISRCSSKAHRGVQHPASVKNQQNIPPPPPQTPVVKMLATGPLQPKAIFVVRRPLAAREPATPSQRSPHTPPRLLRPANQSHGRCVRPSLEGRPYISAIISSFGGGGGRLRRRTAKFTLRAALGPSVYKIWRQTLLEPHDRACSVPSKRTNTRMPMQMCLHKFKA